jgi:hypothetical protein
MLDMEVGLGLGLIGSRAIEADDDRPLCGVGLGLVDMVDSSVPEAAISIGLDPAAKAEIRK